MKILLLFVAAQLAGNAASLLIASVVWRFTRPRLVASRLRDMAAYTAELKPC